MLKRGGGAVLLVALLLLVAWRVRRESPRERPPAPAAEAPKSAEKGPTSPAPPPHDVKPPDVKTTRVPAESGRLKVAVEAPAAFSGVLAVVNRDGRRLAQQDASGEGSASFDFSALPPGPCRAIFVPTRSGAPAAGDVDILPNADASLTLRLAATAGLRGKAVDALGRPLAGVGVSVVLKSAIAPLGRGPDSLLYGTWGQGISSLSSGGYALEADGSLRLWGDTGKDGAFAIAGLPAGAVLVEVGYGPLRYAHACSTDVEARIVVPVDPPAPAPDPAKEERRRAADELLRKMAEHPESADAYWESLKTLLRSWMGRPDMTPADRKAVEDAIAETERLRARK